MGKGGIYGKRKKQEKPKSPREEREGRETSETAEAIARYGTYTKNQGYDTALETVRKRRYERRRGKR